MVSATHPLDAARVVPTTAELFNGFLILGLTGFGGVLPLARRSIVEQHRWLTGEEFVDLLGLCQFLPGGNIINLSITIGLKFRGFTGAIAALVGLMAAPMAIVIGLGILYDRFQDDPHVRHVFFGLAAAASGLLISLAVKIVLPLKGKPVALLIFALCFLAIGVFKLPLLPTMIVLASLSMLATWRIGR